MYGGGFIKKVLFSGYNLAKGMYGSVSSALSSLIKCGLISYADTVVDGFMEDQIGDEIRPSIKANYIDHAGLKANFGLLNEPLTYLDADTLSDVAGTTDGSGDFTFPSAKVADIKITSTGDYFKLEEGAGDTIADHINGRIAKLSSTPTFVEVNNIYSLANQQGYSVADGIKDCWDEGTTDTIEINAIIANLSNSESVAYKIRDFNYSKIVMIGASLIARSYGRNINSPNSAVTTQFNNLGLNVDVYGYGFSGYTTVTILPKIVEAFVAHPTDTLFVIHIGGNDVSAARPYDSMSPAELLDYDDRWDNLFDTLSPRIDDCVVSNITFRSYADPTTSRTIFNDESLGSKPYNDNLYTSRLIANLFEKQNSDGNPVMDMYNWVRNDFENLLSVDGIHFLDPYGENEMRIFMASRLDWIINNTSKPAVIVPKPVDPPALTLVNFDDAPNVGVLNNFDDDIVSRASSIKPPVSVVDNDNVDNGVTVLIESSLDFQSPTSYGINLNGAPFGSPTYDETLSNDAVYKASMFIATAGVLTFTLEGLEANTNYDFEFCGSRVSASIRDTAIKVSTIEVASYQTSGAGSPVAPEQATIQSDGTGKIIFEQSAKAGTYAYLGGFSFIKGV